MRPRRAAAALAWLAALGCSSPPVDLSTVDQFRAARLISAGGEQTCAAHRRRVVCWGWPFVDQQSERRPFALPVADASEITALAVGPRHACMIDAGTVKCWGENRDGALGLPAFVRTSVEPRDVPLVPRATALAVGDTGGCVVAADTGVVCWGDALTAGSIEQLRPSEGPRYIEGIDRARTVAMNGTTACALTDNGVYCWGDNGGLQLGPNFHGSRSDKAVLALAARGVRAIALGAGHVCAALPDAVRCWGDTISRVHSNNNQVATYVDFVVSPDVVELLATGVTTCVRDQAGVGFCWDETAHDEPNPGQSARLDPVTRGELGAVSALALGRSHTCAISATGDLLCWGPNDLGQLGTGSFASSPSPVAVKLAR